MGIWVRQFKRHPETRKRKAHEGEQKDRVDVTHRDLAIVPRDLWNTVAARLSEHAVNYKKPASERTVPHKRSDYLLSGILKCGQCGAPFEIARGTHAAYYRCSANRKRGTCANSLSIREDVAREVILSTLSDRLWNPETLLHIRETIARELGSHRRRAEKELEERSARLDRHEQRIRRLVEMQLDGDSSPTVKEMRRDFEVQAAQERTAIDALKAELGQPSKLPSPSELGEDRILGLDALHEAAGDEVAPAREQLKALLGGGTIHLHPQRAEGANQKGSCRSVVG